VETITITIALFDASRKAEVTLPDDMSVGDLMDQCSSRWSLPQSTFLFRLLGTDELLLEGESIRSAGVHDGAQLQVYPILEGG
jgi:hypothetical protein